MRSGIRTHGLGRYDVSPDVGCGCSSTGLFDGLGLPPIDPRLHAIAGFVVARAPKDLEQVAIAFEFGERGMSSFRTWMWGQRGHHRVPGRSAKLLWRANGARSILLASFGAVPGRGCSKNVGLWRP